MLVLQDSKGLLDGLRIGFLEGADHFDGVLLLGGAMEHLPKLLRGQGLLGGEQQGLQDEFQLHREAPGMPGNRAEDKPRKRSKAADARPIEARLTRPAEPSLGGMRCRSSGA